MEVSVPLHRSSITADAERIREIYGDYYSRGLVKYVSSADENGFLSSTALEGRDDMQITVCGNDDRIVLVARYDNLGKGASGAAIQNMNLLIGADEAEGLNV
jgi:N-acetyl-gamma-glutamyl-phosphate reductase